MNKFLEFLKDASITISCNNFEELLQFFEIMKSNGYELNEVSGGYNFLIDNNKKFEFIASTCFNNISFSSFCEKINSHNNIYDKKPPSNYCFACEATKDIHGTVGCNRCPLIVNSKRTKSKRNCSYSLFNEWVERNKFRKF